MRGVRRAWAPAGRWMLHTPVRRRYRDGSVVLVRYVGRRTGTLHERALAVAREGGHLVVVGPREPSWGGRADRGSKGDRGGRAWWREFEPSGPATVLVEDLQIGVVGRAFDGAEQPAEVAAALRTYLRWFPKAAKSFGVRPGTSRLADLERRAPDLVAVRFDLRGPPVER